jgi:anti-anti-sigma factor
VYELKLTAHHLEDLEDTLLVSPEGTIRGPTTASFREQVDGLLEQTQTASLVIDFSQVQSIDSSTAGFLLNVHDRLDNRGGRLALAALTPSVRVVIDSIGLTTFFSVYPTLEDAVHEFGASS